LFLEQAINEMVDNESSSIPIIEKDLYLAIVLLNLYDYRLKMYTLLFYKFNLRKSQLQPFNK